MRAMIVVVAIRLAVFRSTPSGTTSDSRNASPTRSPTRPPGRGKLPRGQNRSVPETPTGQQARYPPRRGPNSPSSHRIDGPERCPDARTKGLPDRGQGDPVRYLNRDGYCR